MTEPHKLCMDCRFYKLFHWQRRCYHPNNLDLVDQSPLFSAGRLRGSEFSCGKIGKWFESKPVETPPVCPPFGVLTDGGSVVEDKKNKNKSWWERFFGV